MTVTIDKRESGERGRILKSLADKVEIINLGKSPFGGTWSADSKVEAVAPDGHNVVKLFEHKAWEDCIGSSLDGSLDMQCAGVDALIVERSPFDPCRYDREQQRRATVHLYGLSWELPVFITEGPYETMDVLRDVERRITQHGGFKPRTNRIVPPRDSVRLRLLSTVPGFNPDHVLPDGRRAGDAVEALIEEAGGWSDIPRAMRIDEWPSIPGLRWGKGRVNIAKKAFEDAGGRHRVGLPDE